MTKKSKPLVFTKSELIKLLSKKHKITKNMSTNVISNILNSITNTLSQGNRVEIRGLGTFELREYGAYEGHNPQTGEKINVLAKKRPFFKPGKFREKINASRNK